MLFSFDYSNKIKGAICTLMWKYHLRTKRTEDVEMCDLYSCRGIENKPEGCQSMLV